MIMALDMASCRRVVQDCSRTAIVFDNTPYWKAKSAGTR